MKVNNCCFLGKLEGFWMRSAEWFECRMQSAECRIGLTLEKCRWIGGFPHLQTIQPHKGDIPLFLKTKNIFSLFALPEGGLNFPPEGAVFILLSEALAYNGVPAYNGAPSRRALQAFLSTHQPPNPHNPNNSAFCIQIIPHSAFRTPHSALILHFALRRRRSVLHCAPRARTPFFYPEGILFCFLFDILIKINI